jgi:hypothetical protein
MDQYILHSKNLPSENIPSKNQPRCVYVMWNFNEIKHRLINIHTTNLIQTCQRIQKISANVYLDTSVKWSWKLIKVKEMCPYTWQYSENRSTILISIHQTVKGLKNKRKNSSYPLLLKWLRIKATLKNIDWSHNSGTVRTDGQDESHRRFPKRFLNTTKI